MLFRFCSFSSFLPRWFWGWLSWCFGGGLGVGLGLFLLSLSFFLPLFVFFFVWLLVFLVVRRCFFVRFPRPRLGRFRLSLWRWFCVPAASLSSLRASCPVWFVRPAVVCRRSGVVLFFWVLACPLFADGETETNCEPLTLKPPYGGESGGKAAAVAAVSTNLYQEVTTCIITEKNESISSSASGQMPAAKGQTPAKQTGKHGRHTYRSMNGCALQRALTIGAASSRIADMTTIWNTRWSAYGTAWSFSARRSSGYTTP